MVIRADKDAIGDRLNLYMKPTWRNGIFQLHRWPNEGRFIEEFNIEVLEVKALKEYLLKRDKQPMNMILLKKKMLISSRSVLQLV